MMSARETLKGVLRKTQENGKILWKLHLATPIRVQDCPIRAIEVGQTGSALKVMTKSENRFVELEGRWELQKEERRGTWMTIAPEKITDLGGKPPAPSAGKISPCLADSYLAWRNADGEVTVSASGSHSFSGYSVALRQVGNSGVVEHVHVEPVESISFDTPFHTFITLDLPLNTQTITVKNKGIDKDITIGPGIQVMTGAHLDCI